MNWQLSLTFHWPHDRLAIGWQSVKPEKDANYWTFTIFLLILTINLDIE